ncbi:MULTISPECIES: ethanolamine ammonia-lyase subunit EutC [Methylobacterium]|uniref:Ethanolamine ammonia-lyase small subunit n=1 Tax=Methylobacterium jeotgali TaxID=381630 RepID=A0ABQ4SR19_9HYPH|nr:MULTISPECIES: ethanolamine ammonia-lyase subunit EutC [Methylobacterium]PIU04600.1 MAG: ethanolamine ammonia-lyase [Methylobacterium sp. CG09_land_8_20_14_0_10_71_15]PIU15963.1 MAG: ethanolamine ammonia-lyase [Methylobacterium sp. CG08_land_8_20_14_0_20_71_15]GBU17723.1 ethanolamine ammonia-lyase small subunit [Methylobacterium sp.]GJE04888.1 Ethanolamine ammonia-lyase light chain [Methylobacterium jeotgali]
MNRNVTEPAGKAAEAPLRSLRDLRGLTQARIALGAHGSGVPTQAALAFNFDHARAREAVWTAMDADAIREALTQQGLDSLAVRSSVTDRAEYLRRPDRGRTLHADAETALAAAGSGFDVGIAIADGLSATAVTLNAVPMAAALAGRIRAAGLSLAPVVVASQARVALGDPIGARLGLRCLVMLIGERPGLSAADSLGCYVTFAPEVGLPDSRRNCISNIRQDGLSIEAAADQVAGLLRVMFAQGTSGVALRREEPPPVLPMSDGGPQSR